jgi:hypothetical protein
MGIGSNNIIFMQVSYNNRMQSDFGKLRSPQPLMRGIISIVDIVLIFGTIGE